MLTKTSFSQCYHERITERAYWAWGQGPKGSQAPGSQLLLEVNETTTKTDYNDHKHTKDYRCKMTSKMTTKRHKKTTKRDITTKRHDTTTQAITKKCKTTTKKHKMTTETQKHHKGNYKEMQNDCKEMQNNNKQL